MTHRVDAADEQLRLDKALDGLVNGTDDQLDPQDQSDDTDNDDKSGEVDDDGELTNDELGES